MRTVTTKEIAARLKDKYPTVPQAVIDKICMYGMRKLHQAIAAGEDIKISRTKGSACKFKIYTPRPIAKANAIAYNKVKNEKNNNKQL